MPFNSMPLMDSAGNTALFGLGLWLTCALAGTAVGAAVAAAQIFSGRWHPAWAAKLVYWFSCPFFAGITTGVLLALKSVPPLAPARTFWLLLCLVIGAITATLAAGAVAYLSKNYDPNAACKAKRISRRARIQGLVTTNHWEDRLRAVFRPEPTAETDSSAAVAKGQNVNSQPTVPGQRAKLPPERFAVKSELAKPPHYAGHPRQVVSGRSKLQNPER
jgi:hypothetical protein